MAPELHDRNMSSLNCGNTPDHTLEPTEEERKHTPPVSDRAVICYISEYATLWVFTPQKQAARFAST